MLHIKNHNMMVEHERRFFLKEHNEAKKNINIRNPLKSIPIFPLAPISWIVGSQQMGEHGAGRRTKTHFNLLWAPGACGCTQGAPAGGTRWWCVGLDQEPGNLWQRTVASEPVQFLVTDSGPTPPHAVRGASVIQILYLCFYDCF